MNFFRRRDRAEERDVIYREKIHAVEEESITPTKGIIDVPFLLITAALLLFGCVMVYSASSVYAEQYHDDTTYFIAKHLVFLLMGVAFATFIALFCTPVFWHDTGYVLFGLAVVLLLMVPVIGTDLGSGAKRWLDFGIVTLQPSEIAKLALVLTLARYMSKHEKQITADPLSLNFKYGVFFPGLIIIFLIALDRKSVV